MAKNLTHCPNCDHPLIIMAARPVRQPAWQPGLATLQHSAPMQSTSVSVEPGDEWQRITPIGRLSTGDVTTAIYDAGVSFVLVTIASGVAIWLINGLEFGGYIIDLGWWAAPVSGVSVALWRYFDGMGIARGLLEIVETLKQSKSAPPPPKPDPVPLEVIQRDKAGVFQRMFRASLPAGISEEKFLNWCKYVVLRPDLTQSKWVASGEFVRTDYTKLLDTLGESGVVKRKSKAKNSEWVLTPEGKETLTFYIRLVHSPSLTR